ncbi:ATP-binding cassette domain-containing protein [Paenibacillus contaminans]|uniref:Cobalt transporter ATP-binding subunit n=1 Tax=Paenibacillus contaminans TaxID=450362 RepID=A0A329MUA9_9BACL|nr:ATP-binding cassette domain-containing protein [Paenibacillus contaminans]RAV21547.1 cobalt transporter ATP-binding subunit [Paenibacillus contaminans]
MAYELNQVSVSIAGREVLRNVSCTLQEGKWISVIGQTGAGKSTFAKVIKGLIPSYKGEYTLHQQPLPDDSKGRMKAVREIGFVFQYPEHQIFETTVYKELTFGPKMLGYSQKRIEEALKPVLEQVGLSTAILQVPPFNLSGGQKRRVAIASVLLADPKMLILDEPTAGLDPSSRRVMLQMLKEWQQMNNRTVLFISHQMEDVADYSDEVMVLHKGHLLVHSEANSLFMKNTEVLERAGLPLPEPVQLLRLVEELSGHRIEVESCREQDILNKVRLVWEARSLQND